LFYLSGSGPEGARFYAGLGLSPYMLVGMQKHKGLIVVLLVIALGHGLHLLLNYEKIQRTLRENSAHVIHPKVDDDAKAEIGYIYQMRDENFIREGKLNLVWFVVVPATNVHYSCSYDSGFPDFKIGDGVRIIHNKDDSESDYGYLVGLHEKKQGKATLVWTINSDDLSMDLEGDP
jgi:hypothetical protein